FFPCSADHSALHSFPTRRSSDLCPAEGRAANRAICQRPTTYSELRLRVQSWLRGSQPRVEDRQASHPCGRKEIARDHIGRVMHADRKSTRLNSSHVAISYAVFCL